MVVGLSPDRRADINDATLRLALASAGLTTVWIALSLAALRDVLRAPVADVPAPPVTVLKPLAGADPSLAENLESFFVQDHPDHEILFGCEDPDDPAVPIVRALIAAHPEVRARLLIHDGPRGSNPKVRNLRGLIAHASHDLVLVSDSNVCAPRGYVREAACAWGGDVGLVTNLFAGAPREGATVAAWVESVLLAGFCAPGAALPTSLGHAAVIGKSMLFSRREIDSFGGLERVADVMAEDKCSGECFKCAGAAGAWAGAAAPPAASAARAISACRLREKPGGATGSHVLASKTGSASGASASASAPPPPPTTGTKNSGTMMV